MSRGSDRLAFAIALLWLASLPGSPAAAANDDFLFTEEPGSLSSFAVQGAAVLPLPNGGQVTIAPLLDSQGQAHGAVLVELVPRGGPRATSHASLEAKDPRELFHALATRGVTEPGFLTRLFPDPGDPAEQGWARRELSGLSAGPGRSHGGVQSCHEDAQTFDDMADDVGTFGWGFSFLGERIQQLTHPQYFWGLPTYNLHELWGGVSDVEAFFSTVVVCANNVDLSPQDEELMPLFVEYSYRIGNGAFIGVGQHVVDSGDEVVFYWTRSSNDSMPYGIDVEPHEAPDFRLHVGNASTHDLLHIGATWSKPFDSLTY